MATDAFEADGFTVIEAASADYGAVVVQSRNDVRVVFTEATTPGDLNGFDLARMAQAQNPQTIAVIVGGSLPSGFSGIAPKARFLPKPYRMSEVLRLIDEPEPG